MRAVLCPDKINTAEWFEVMETAHAVGLRSTATIMFGHVDGYRHWARHLLRVRALQERTGGFTEFVPLPFVHMEAPIYLKGQARKGPTFREAVLMHAVARLALDPRHPQHPGLLGEDGPRRRGAAACDAGCNDLGGVLMNEFDHARGRRHARPGAVAPPSWRRMIRGARPHAAPAHHALRPGDAGARQAADRRRCRGGANATYPATQRPRVPR